MLYLKHLESSLLTRPMPTTGQALLTFSYMLFSTLNAQVEIYI